MVDSERCAPRVLFVGIESAAARRALEAGGLSVAEVPDAGAARAALANPGGPAGVVTAAALPDGDGLDLLRAVRDDHPGLPVVLAAADGSEALASEAVRAGAADYVPLGSVAPAELAERVVDAVAAGGDDEPVTADVDGEADLEPTPDGGVAAARDRTIPESVKERAMDEAPVGITLSDPALEDNPLIYVNPAFERLTGYAAEEVLGRNCRFLQGEGTAAEPVAELRRAIDAEEPVSVELVNYRTGGERFWNRVEVAPIYDDDGELVHYVGFQLDVTDRVEAERTAERRAEQLRVEREHLEHLLDRVEGLVANVTEALVSAASRADVERTVPARLVEAEPFSLAWVGRRDLAAEAVVAAEWAPGSADLDGFAVGLDGEDPVARAVATGEVQVAPVAGSAHAGDGPAALPEADGAGAVAAVPLTDRATCYGALVAYVPDVGAVDERERVVLGALGRAVATAIDAQESRRMLADDDVVELEVALADRTPFAAAMAAELDCELTFLGAVAPEAGPPLLFFSATGTAPEAVAAFVADRDSPASVEVLADGDGRTVLEFAVPDEPIVRLLTDRGAKLQSMHADADGLELTAELPREADARAVVDALAERFDGVDLRAYRQRERPARTRPEFVAALEERLTDRQLTALQKAFVGGFFEWPRDTSGDELADSMDISRSTFHQHLRAAQRKLVEAFYER